MSFLLYCLGVYFWFYLFNCSDIAAPARAKILASVHESISYALQCSYCATFWITVAACCATLVPISYVFAAPVVNLFLFKSFERLTS